MKYTVLFSLFFLASSFVQADTLIEITRQKGTLTYKLVVDEQRTVRVVGLPLAGDFYFNANTGTLFSRLPGERVTYAVPLGKYAHRVPHARVAKQGKWKDYFESPSFYWRMEVEDQTCSHVFANQAAAVKARLNITDLTRLNAALTYLLGPAYTGTCGPYIVDPAAGAIVGLPLYGIHQGSGDAGTSEVTEIVEVEGPANKLNVPTTVQLTAMAHARFLKTMLGGAELATFNTISGQLPHQQQVRALKILLRDKVAGLNP